MSTIYSAANSPAHLPPTPDIRDTHGISAVDSLGIGTSSDTGSAIATGTEMSMMSNTQTVNHLTQAVQQTLGHLSPSPHIHAAAVPTATATSGSDLPMTMQGFIRDLIASLHQIGVTHSASSPSGSAPTGEAVAATGSKYTPGTVNDVQNLMQQASAVLSSNAVLQQDFQTMMRAAGVHETPSLDHFLRSVSSRMGGQSSTVSAVA